MRRFFHSFGCLLNVLGLSDNHLHLLLFVYHLTKTQLSQFAWIDLGTTEHVSQFLDILTQVFFSWVNKHEDTEKPFRF